MKDIWTRAVKRLTQGLSVWREQIFYLAVGLTTVAVNTGVFMAIPTPLGAWPMRTSVLAANSAAFAVAVLFAYFANTLLVFRRRCTWRNFGEFMGLRLLTLALDSMGTVFLMGAGMDKLAVKILINAFIIVLNYFCSKYWIYKRKEGED